MWLFVFLRLNIIPSDAIFSVQDSIFNVFLENPIRLSNQGRKTYKMRAEFHNFRYNMNFSMFYKCINAEKEGGALFLNRCNVSLFQCHFKDCHAKYSGSIHISHSQISSISDSSIHNSSAEWVGGCFADGRQENDSFNIYRSNFSESNAQRWVGGLRVQHNSGVVQQCSFTRCTAEFSGAFFDYSSNPSNRNISLCFVNNCTGGSHSSGITAFRMLFRGLIADCCFRNNHKGSVLVYADSSILSIVSCFFDKEYEYEIHINYNTSILSLNNNSFIKQL